MLNSTLNEYDDMGEAIHLVQFTDQWGTFVNTVMNFRYP
jgi:hypothetical protein